MISGIVSKWVAGWRGRKKRREEYALGWIKARYHVFRVLLANNERALESMAEIDRLLGENEPTRLTAAVAAFCETVLELADGLNRLTDNAYPALYPQLASLEARLEKALGERSLSPRRVWLDLAEVTPDMRQQVGGKAFPLGGLIRAGLPVPEGVCLTRRACREYLRQTRLEDRLQAISRQSASPEADLRDLSVQAKAMIEASTPPEAFVRQLGQAWARLAEGGDGTRISVRSSASSEDGSEHSFAGQYASVLGVDSPEAMLRAFKTVLASAFSDRAMAYRAQAGVGGQSLDMAVLCQKMVDARTAGVLFTRDPMNPESGRMLVTAVPGLGTQAVSGRSPADVYRPARDMAGEPAENTPAEIAEKTRREVQAEAGGLRLEEVAGDERTAPLLAPADIDALRGLALRAEALAGGPRDIEWAIDRQGRVWILQSRPARLGGSSRPGRPGAEDVRLPGEVLLQGGVGASPGRAAGRLFAARSRRDLDAAAKAEKPVVLALHQSLVEAASLVSEVAAIVVDMGNPLDHLAALSREQGLPMVTGLGTATTVVEIGRWVLVDGDRGMMLTADPLVWRDAPAAPRRVLKAGGEGKALRDLVLPLNLTDAYGPTFSILECKSLHDMVRFIHEKAVIALFEAGDAIAEESFSLVRRIEDESGLSFLIIDLGGALVPGHRGQAGAGDILCEPLAALCRGMRTPGLRWGKPPPVLGVSGLMSRAMLDGRGERPVGNPNYALASRDYLNLNARVDYHFAMVDAVCGANPRENSIRFRFKGGGTTAVQRERRARFVESVLGEEEFFTTRQKDMVTAVLSEGSRETVRAKMEMLGRFLGFSRLLDAVMVDDDMPDRLARAFLSGDYDLESLAAEVAERKDTPGG